MIEQTLRFGDNDGLIGTVTLPQDCARADVGVLWLNSGVIPRMGPHRLHVRLARAVAAAGHVSMRFDLSGLGDSLPASNGLDFETQWVLDTRAAMDAVEARTGVGRFVLFGICSGAVLAYATALADPRVAGCVMFDPYMYPTWRTHLNRVVARVQESGLVSIIGGWAHRGLNSAARALKSKSEGGGRADGIATASQFGLRRPPKADFAAGLGALVDRGTEVLVVYAGSSLYHYNYPGQFADAFRRFGIVDRIAVTYLPEVDHSVTELAGQARVLDTVAGWIAARFPARAEALSV